MKGIGAFMIAIGITFILPLSLSLSPSLLFFLGLFFFYHSWGDVRGTKIDDDKVDEPNIGRLGVELWERQRKPL